MNKTVIALGALALFAAAPAVYAANEKKATAPAVKTPSIKPEKTEAADASGNITGKVVETMSAGGYTYVCLEQAGEKTWVAVSETPVTVGAQMSFRPGQVMTNFSSKSLNRTFDSIVFSGGLAAQSGKPHSSNPHGDMVPGGDPNHIGSKANVGSLDKTARVAKAAGPNAYTVSEVYAKSKSLNKKKIAVRGKVVKFSRGIMGRNWVHIQDGTGDQAKGTHNLVATTQDMAAVGDVVTATGTFAKDKDFGAGYLYKAIIEDAKVQQ